MSLDLLKEKFGYSVKKEKDNREKIHETLNDKFNFNGIRVDDREKIHETLNNKFNSNGMNDIKSVKIQHQEELEEKDKTIKNLEIENSNLTNQVLNLERQNSNILDELNRAKWLENNIASTTKKIYEDKIKTMSYVDSTELIPLLTEVSREKQGFEKLTWDKWLEIPESKYLYQINEHIAKKVFQETNDLINEALSVNLRRPDLYRRRRYGGDEPAVKNYFLSFTGDTNVATRRGDLVATDFQPHNYDGAGSSIGTDGFTISFWLRPDEIVTDGFAIGFKSGAHDRFEFGMKDADQVFFGVASNEFKSSWKDMNDAVVGENANDGFTAAEMNELFDGGTDWKTDGTWYHIAISYVGHAGASAGDRYRRVYLNGRQLRGEGVGPSANDGDFNWDTGNRKIIDEGLSFGMRAVKGSGTTVSYNNGLACGLDEVAIYKGVKDSDFIADVYNGGTNYNHTGISNLIAYWKFNEGSGTRLEDFGPYGYHGLLTNDSHGFDGGDSGGWVSGTPTWYELGESYG